MTQPTKREQLAAMRLEDFKACLRSHHRPRSGASDRRRSARQPATCAQSQEGSASAKAKEALSKDVLAAAFDDHQ